jgi:uncharacterized alkaline shock family protein YloU
VASLSVKKIQRVAVDVYIIIAYGTKISEVCRNVQDKVKYNLGVQCWGMAANSVNVFVQGVKVDW